jgi:hypothetical protein
VSKRLNATTSSSSKPAPATKLTGFAALRGDVETARAALQATYDDLAALPLRTKAMVGSPRFGRGWRERAVAGKSRA